MSSKDKRKLAAIMFADIVGYSRMMASDEERTLELLKKLEMNYFVNFHLLKKR